jgi:hypothetical protein
MILIRLDTNLGSILCREHVELHPSHEGFRATAIISPGKHLRCLSDECFLGLISRLSYRLRPYYGTPFIANLPSSFLTSPHLEKPPRAKMKWKSLAIIALSSSLASASLNAILAAAPGAQNNHAITSILSGLTHTLDRRQDTGRCGADYNSQRCPDIQCCSAYGYCGNEFEFCAPIVGCQPQYGRCGDLPSSSSSISAPTSTPIQTPSPSSSSSVVPSSTLSSVTPPLPSASLIVSTSGQCGNVTTCAGSAFGGCCSEWYFCGNGVDYCGVGCRVGFGGCGGGGAPVPSSSSSSSPISSSTSTSTPPPSSTPPPIPTSSTSISSSTSRTSSSRPTPTVPVSTDGKCGNGITCTGSTFGRCCSDYYWCGDQDEYCRVAYGCRLEWGSCGSVVGFGLMGGI